MLWKNEFFFKYNEYKQTKITITNRNLYRISFTSIATI